MIGPCDSATLTRLACLCRGNQNDHTISPDFNRIIFQYSKCDLKLLSFKLDVPIMANALLISLPRIIRRPVHAIDSSVKFIRRKHHLIVCSYLVFSGRAYDSASLILHR